MMLLLLAFPLTAYSQLSLVHFIVNKLKSKLHNERFSSLTLLLIRLHPPCRIYLSIPHWPNCWQKHFTQERQNTDLNVNSVPFTEVYDVLMFILATKIFYATSGTRILCKIISIRISLKVVDPKVGDNAPMGTLGRSRGRWRKRKWQDLSQPTEKKKKNTAGDMAWEARGGRSR